MALNFWTSARFTIPLPEGHRFPLEKYALLRDQLLTDGMVRLEELHEPARVPREAVQRVHTSDYIARLTNGALSEPEIRRLGFPWSPALVERSLRAAGGTFEALQCALLDGVAMNLAGGTHHAFADHGEGFCVLNDVAIAVRDALVTGRIERAVIIDLDVHQGNGTHHIFLDDPAVFTFSMHGRRNYPFIKIPGTLDIELEDGTMDEEYLGRLADALPRVIRDARADVGVYLAGADPLAGDRLGRLRLTHEGLARRDHLVMRSCREVGIPMVIAIAGGYGRDIASTVAVHAATARIAREYS